MSTRNLIVLTACSATAYVVLSIVAGTWLLFR